MDPKKDMIIDIDAFQKAQENSKKLSVRKLKDKLHISTDEASYLKKVWNDEKFKDQEDKRIYKELKKVAGKNYDSYEVEHLHFYCFNTTRELRKRKKMQKLAMKRVKLNPKNAKLIADKPYFYELERYKNNCK